MNHINDSIKLQAIRNEGQPVWMRLLKFGLLDGSYLAKLRTSVPSRKLFFSVYVVTKFLYVLNLIGQFFMMNKFLGQNDPYWGAKILSDIMTGTDWELSGIPSASVNNYLFRQLSPGGNVRLSNPDPWKSPALLRSMCSFFEYVQ